MTSPLSPAEKRTTSIAHVPALDGLRGIAILVVMVLHFRRGIEAPLESFVDRALFRTLTSGWIGVDLFFVLSGFLITGILLRMREEPDYYRTFFVRRALRIFPLYYAFLVARFLLLPAINERWKTWLEVPWSEQIWAWLYLVNVRIATGIPNVPFGTEHFWSLAVEEQFYLFWPFVVRKLSMPRFTMLCIVLVVVGPLARTADVLWEVSSGRPSAAGYVLPIFRIDTFAWGALVAIAMQSAAWRDRLATFAPRVVPALAVVIAAVFVWRRGFIWADPVIRIGAFSVLVVLFAGLVVLALTGTFSQRLMDNRVLRFFGRYSYAMYVVHLPLIPVAVEWGFSPQGYWATRMYDAVGIHAFGIAIYMAGAIVITVVVSVLSWHLWEKQFLRFKPVYGSQVVTSATPRRGLASGDSSG